MTFITYIPFFQSGAPAKAAGVGRFKHETNKVSFLHDTALTPKGRGYVKHDEQAVPFQTSIQYCCIIRMTLKKNNVFVNLTKTTGQTIIKFSAGLVQKKKNKKVLKPTIKWILEKIAFFVKKNFNCVKVVIKGHTTKSFSYLKELKRKKLRLISFQNRIPIVHNGCRPPKKRRI